MTEIVQYEGNLFDQGETPRDTLILSKLYNYGALYTQTALTKKAFMVGFSG